MSAAARPLKATGPTGSYPAASPLNIARGGEVTPGYARRTMRHRNVLGALSLAAALTTAGCTGGSPGADPAPPASGSPSGPASSPTTSDPTVAPATGRLMRTSDATVNAPEGWTSALAKTYDHLTLAAPDGVSSVTLSDFGTVTDADTEKLVRQAAAADRPRNPTVEPADLGTAPGVHLAYHDGQFDVDYYGAIMENTFVYVQFTQYTEVPAAKQQEVIDSVLASFRWT